MTPGFKRSDVVRRAATESQTTRQARLDAHAAAVGPHIEAYRQIRYRWRTSVGLLTLKHPLVRGGFQWTPTQVKRVYQRCLSKPRQLGLF